MARTSVHLRLVRPRASCRGDLRTCSIGRAGSLVSVSLVVTYSAKQAVPSLLPYSPALFSLKEAECDIQRAFFCALAFAAPAACCVFPLILAKSATSQYQSIRALSPVHPPTSSTSARFAPPSFHPPVPFEEVEEPKMLLKKEYEELGDESGFA